MRLVLIVSFALALFAPDGAKEGRRGNDLFREGNYARAVEAYRQGLARMTGDPGPVRASLYNNLGAAQYQLENYGDARRAFSEGLSAATTSEGKTRLGYNAGNASFREKQLQQALEYYRNALLTNPDHENAKFNYEYVKRRLNEQGQGNKSSDDNQNQQQENGRQNNQNGQNQQNSQDQQNGQNRQNGQNDREQRSDEQRQQNHQGGQNQQNQNGQQQNQSGSSSGNQPQSQSSQGGDQAAGQQQKRQLSREEALRILQALEASEENVLRRMRPEQQPDDRTVEKDW